MHPDRRAHQVGAQRRRRDLEAAALPAHAVVIADPAVFLDAQDVAPEHLGHLDEGRGWFVGGLGKSGVVLGQVDLAKEPVGGRDGGDPGQRELLRQAILQGAEGALAPASGFR